ncbi:MAG: DUF2459 domain-containing protein, partial [Crocinitomicaceae bacterium]|nr:DUF2459 domain-containing protein [Crocinitomicaceae bacterium]
MDLKKNFFHAGKTIILFIEFFFLFICFYLNLVLWGLSISNGSYDQNGSIDIYVRNNGVHTDICIPMKCDTVDWSSYFNLDDYGKD